jgi:hypothetical protein
MIVGMVVPVGRRSNFSTDICLEKGRFAACFRLWVSEAAFALRSERGLAISGDFSGLDLRVTTATCDVPPAASSVVLPVPEAPKIRGAVVSLWPSLIKASFDCTTRLLAALGMSSRLRAILWRSYGTVDHFMIIKSSIIRPMTALCHSPKP